MKSCPKCSEKDARIGELEAEAEAARLDADDAVARHDDILRLFVRWGMDGLLDRLEDEGITWLEPDDTAASRKVE